MACRQLVYREAYSDTRESTRSADKHKKENTFALRAEQPRMWQCFAAYLVWLVNQFGMRSLSSPGMICPSMEVDDPGSS